MGPFDVGVVAAAKGCPSVTVPQSVYVQPIQIFNLYRGRTCLFPYQCASTSLVRASVPYHPDYQFLNAVPPYRRGGFQAGSNNYNGAPLLMDEQARIGEITRTTKETDVKVSINLDGSGICDCSTGIPFLDHMLDQLASHGLFDINIKAKGDLHIDDHHTNEDVALALGTALLQALGDRKGIHRFGDFSAPLDEALVHVVLDLSGRPYLHQNLHIPTQRVGTYDTQLVKHFFQSLVNTSGMTLHIHQLSGENSHHIIEATFKAFARALRKATEYDERRKGSIPSSKGILSRA
eukprot:c22422_g1_i1 orf=91-966(+)